MGIGMIPRTQGQLNDMSSVQFKKLWRKRKWKDERDKKQHQNRFYLQGGNLPPQRVEVWQQSRSGKSLNGHNWVPVITGVSSKMTEVFVLVIIKTREWYTNSYIQIGISRVLKKHKSKQINPPLLPGIWEPVELESIPMKLRRNNKKSYIFLQCIFMYAITRSGTYRKNQETISNLRLLTIQMLYIKSFRRSKQITYLMSHHWKTMFWGGISYVAFDIKFTSRQVVFFSRQLGFLDFFPTIFFLKKTHWA